ncbi:nucleotidyltransferase domain-containing protein [Cytobacillus gottheilii]|uniref:nucleotidyltransferase domain-containing protein n=1 Tax=Cytobacillus gottheilii TaxID=859144 RepID=UPI0009BA12BE|nr:nucleotidyltransferase domain-containing protein [Cytobacillus gottheilii]
MKNEIVRYLNKIEAEYHVKIIYACESGSRVWGYSTESSDYDVRFVYVHHPDYYLSIDPVGVGAKRDVIEQTPANELDFAGWDLTKALKMFRKSNPSFLEWLYSEDVYIERYDTAKAIRKLTGVIFSPQTGLFHYVNMAEGNMKGAERGSDFQVKRWINVLRPLLAAKWIEEKCSFPPLNVQSLLDEVNLEDNMNKIGRKILAREQGEVKEQLLLFRDYAKQEISRILTEAKKSSEKHGDYTDELNAIFRKTLKKAWLQQE